VENINVPNSVFSEEIVEVVSLSHVYPGFGCGVCGFQKPNANSVPFPKAIQHLRSFRRCAFIAQLRVLDVGIAETLFHSKKEVFHRQGFLRISFAQSHGFSSNSFSRRMAR